MAPPLGRLAAALAEAAAVLEEEARGHALVGGLGVSVRTEPRTTRDVDLAIATTDDGDAEQVILAFVRRGWGAVTTVEHEATGRLGTVRLRPPEGVARGVYVDLLFASSGVEGEIVGEAERLAVFPGVVVPVARSAHLLATKVLSRDDAARGQDRVDIRKLLEVCSAADVAAARRTLATITQRGYARRKDLAAELEQALAEGGTRA